MAKFEYVFLGYVVICDKCDILLKRQFEDEYEAIKFAREKLDFGFSVSVEKVTQLINWEQVALLDNGDITSSNE